jgi:uncharacterized protein
LKPLLALCFFALPALAAPMPEPASASRFRLLSQALAQADQITGDWDPSQRDCAGFVRFLYRKSVPSETPLWRDRNDQPALFLTAGDLLAYNFESLGLEPERDRIETGDLLAFHLPHKPPADAYHLMVLLRPPGMAADRTLVAYHNGSPAETGHVRKLWLDDLKAGPPEWRPTRNNPAFLGTFRWRGWTGRPSKGR